MRSAALVLTCLALAGCAAAVPEGTVVTRTPSEALPDGYPPRIGEVVATLDGKPQAWTTYDYSIGAFDAAVQILGYGDAPELRLMAEPGPNASADRLVMKATMRSKRQTGALQQPLIEIVAGKDWNGARLSSLGAAAEIVIDSVTVDPEREVLGRIKGHFSATLCAATGQPAVVDRSNCRDISGTFDSGLQFSGF